MKWPTVVACALVVIGCGLGFAEQAQSQGLNVDTRVGFLVTFAEGHSDRPLVGLNLGVPVVAPSVGGGPGLTLTGGVSVGFADFFADVQSESFRFTGGVEAPWAIGAASLGRRPIRIVPHVEAGYLDSNGGDRRSGLVWRAGLGVRVPVGAGNMHFTFEPLAIVGLPEGRALAKVDEPLRLSGLTDSRLALEFGVLSVGWRF